jgi:hypothetical protein
MDRRLAVCLVVCSVVGWAEMMGCWAVWKAVMRAASLAFAMAASMVSELVVLTEVRMAES